MSDNIIRCPLVPSTIDLPQENFGKTLTAGILRNSSQNVITDVTTGETITGRELVDCAEVFARRLLSQGCCKGDVLTIFSPNSIDWVLVFLASFHIGLTVSTINSLITSGELAFQLNAASATYIFTVPSLASVVVEASKNIPIRKIFLTKAHNGCVHLPTRQLKSGDQLPTLPTFDELDTKPIDVALIVSSSGTTGVQKGVMLSHQNLQAEFAIFIHPRIRIVDEKFIVFAQLSHLAGLVGPLFAMADGGVVLMLERFDFELFLKTVAKHKLSRLFVVPPIATLLAKSPEVDNYDLPLKDIIIGAAPLSADLEDMLMKRFPGLVVRQLYGMTEVSGLSTCVPLGVPGKREKRRPGSIGVTLHNLQLKIVDVETGAALGPHRRGEVCMRGPTIMLGYANNPEATAAMIEKDGWLHSGDIGYYDEDGYFYIVDRIKELIKYNAYQVAPAEVEAVLISHPEIADAGVVGVPDAAAGELPMAWVVLKPGAVLNERNVQDFVAGKVAPYKKLRGGVRFVPSIPKTTSGKILRRHIRQIGLDGKL